MSEPTLDPKTEAELTALLEQLKTQGQNWKDTLDKGEEMFKRHQQQLKRQTKAS